MYSPTTRLLAVLELLQSYKQMSGSEIARRLEVDPRTVRRYIVILQDMGIPVEGERGPYGTYQLQRGFKMPPLMYTDAEAVAITLGLLAIREFQFPVDVATIEAALAKTERVLPEKVFQQVRGLQEAIAFNASLPTTHLQNDFVTRLSLAVQQRQRVHIHYQSWNEEVSERDFDPYGVVFNAGYWYTAGYCHLRQGLRTFRLDRIVALGAADRSFERPDDFDALSYVLNSVAQMPGTAQVEVLLHTTLDHAQRVISPIIGSVEQTDEGVLLRRAATQLEWIAFILLSFDFRVKVLQPIELRERLKVLAARAAQISAD